MSLSGQTTQTTCHKVQAIIVSSLPQKTLVVDETAERIAIMIRSGEFAPGDKLPSERRFSEMLGVGRSSVREAIRKLEVMGLLEVRHSRGTYVASPEQTAPLAFQPPAILQDREQLRQLFGLRRIMEVAAAELAAQRAQDEHLTMMRYWVQAMENCAGAKDADGIVIADIEFHRQIFLAAGNAYLLDLMDSIVDVLRDMRYASASIPDLIPHNLIGHRSILAAIEKGDGRAAARAMDRHLLKISELVEAYWLAGEGEDLSEGEA